jgi:hypothetical protein
MDALSEVLAPHLESSTAIDHNTRTSYLTRLSTLSLADLSSAESAFLLQNAQSHLRNLQALSKRSHQAVIESSTHLAQLKTILPSFGTQATTLKEELPSLEDAASAFAKKYERGGKTDVIERRKKALLLSRNVDRVSDVLELPTLLSSTVSAAQNASATSTSSTATSYASALDLHAHIKRLNALYPQSSVVLNVSRQAEAEIENLTAILITGLQASNLKLAAAMRTVGWLRRVAPELSESEGTTAPSSTRAFDVSVVQKSDDGALGTLFLVCRLQALHTTLQALQPLRELADQEPVQHVRSSKGTASTNSGTQSERYLKRYIEIFREHSFSIVSMYKSIFPNGLPSFEHSEGESAELAGATNPLLPLPSPLSSFTLHLSDLLAATMREYLPKVSDKSSRESLLTQVLYCAGSLGRLGADFGMVVALLDAELTEDVDVEGEDESEPEWVVVMKKQRVQAGRLEVLARGVGGGGRKASGSMEVTSPSAVVAGT